MHLPSPEATDQQLLCCHPASHIEKIKSYETAEYGKPELVFCEQLSPQPLVCERCSRAHCFLCVQDSENESDKTLYPDCKWLDGDTYSNQYSNVLRRAKGEGRTGKTLVILIPTSLIAVHVVARRALGFGWIDLSLRACAERQTQKRLRCHSTPRTTASPYAFPSPLLCLIQRLHWRRAITRM